MKEKTKKICFKVSPWEIDLIHQKMNEAGIRNLSAYLIKMAIDGYVIRMEMSDVKEILRLMQINSNNLNQYAKRANETGNIYLEDIKDLQRIQKELIRLMGNVLERLTNID